METAQNTFNILHFKGTHRSHGSQEQGQLCRTTGNASSLSLKLLLNLKNCFFPWSHGNNPTRLDSIGTRGQGLSLPARVYPVDSPEALNDTNLLAARCTTMGRSNRGSMPKITEYPEPYGPLENLQYPSPRGLRSLQVSLSSSTNLCISTCPITSFPTGDTRLK